MKRNWIRTLILTSAALAITVAVPAKASEPATDVQRLEAMAKQAVTAADHANVARQYRLRAESLAAKAEQHEKEARRLKAQPRPGMAYKWPSMVGKPWEKEEKLAMQARRASAEALTVADRHIRLSVETKAAE